MCRFLYRLQYILLQALSDVKQIIKVNFVKAVEVIMRIHQSFPLSKFPVVWYIVLCIIWLEMQTLYC